MMHYELTLFVTGATARSLRAIANLRRFCDSELAGQFVIELVDLYTHPARAEADQIIAAPTLVRKSPKPVRYALGDLSNTDALRLTIMGG